MVDSWLRALERAGQAFAQPAVDEDAAAQARLREQFPADPLFADSGTGELRTYTPEEQAANRRAFASFIFGPERGSIFGGEASRPERVVRDWIFSEQEFRTSAERFEQGSWRSGFGWGALGLAGVIPIAGDAAQVAGRLGRAAEAAGDVARAAGDVAPAARSADRLRNAPRFDPDEAMYYAEDFDYLYEPNVPDKVYHVAPASARESIEAVGLDPSNATWNTGAGSGQSWFEEAIWDRLGDSGELIPVEYRPEGIYAFESLEEAQRYAAGGGDIYEIDLARVAQDGGPVIRDPSNAQNWDYLDDFERAYVTRVVPEGYFRRVEEIEGVGLESLVEASRRRVQYDLMPEQTLSTGVRVPSYSDRWFNKEPLDQFTEMQTTIPQFGKLNNQWMQVQDDTLGQYQAYLLGPNAQISDELSALAHWQYVGNNNIQSLLRTGQMPVVDSYERAVQDLMGSWQVPRSEIDRIFSERANQAIPFLDDLISQSNTHGGFISYRGIDRASVDAAFGDDFYAALATDPQSLIGLSWTDDAYTASSLDAIRAREFAYGGDRRPTPYNMGVILRITVPDGVGAAPVNGYLNMFSPAFANEYEMLIGRGATFRITDVATPLDQGELINPKWNNMRWNPDEQIWENLRTDAIPVVHIEVVP